jgi:hypothetical protein
MVCATFRFYDELNDFLPRERRGRDITVPCARMATTKHMIEALGVPHTEVELVLVNGEGAGLDRLLEEGDRVAVYPRFTRFDVARWRRRPCCRRDASASSPTPTWAAWRGCLRMAGFDTIYDNGLRDDQIEAMAAEEERVVLTRDRDLLKRRTIAYGCYVRAMKPEEQLREVFERLGLADSRARSRAACTTTAAARGGEGSVIDRLPRWWRQARTNSTPATPAGACTGRARTGSACARTRRAVRSD